MKWVEVEPRGTIEFAQSLGMTETELWNGTFAVLLLLLMGGRLVRSYYRWMSERR